MEGENDSFEKHQRAGREASGFNCYLPSLISFGIIFYASLWKQIGVLVTMTAIVIVFMFS